MREIKFKGKRVDNEEFVEGDLIHGVGSKLGKMFILPRLHIYPKDCHELDGYEVIPETLGIYSGQLSREEIEICEGDVLKFEDEQIGVVRWADGGLVVDADFGDYDTTVLGWAIDALGDCDIIGNIHDNPELLNPKL